MLALELACAAIVAVYVVARREALPTLALLAVAGFLGEDSVIRAYGFYFYSPRWHLFLDRVPLMIVAHLADRDPLGLVAGAPPGAAPSALAPLIGAGIVLADASLIEPIAVHAGLWTLDRAGPLRRAAHRHHRLGLLRRRRHGLPRARAPRRCRRSWRRCRRTCSSSPAGGRVQVAVTSAARRGPSSSPSGSSSARSRCAARRVPGRRAAGISQGFVTSWTRSRLLLRLTPSVWPRPAVAVSSTPLAFVPPYLALLLG